MSTHIFCPTKEAACVTPSRCLQACQQVCPPCNHDCNQRRTCPAMVTRNGGDTIIDGRPLPAQPKTFQPDFGITSATYTTRLTLIGYVLAIWAVLMFVIFIYRHA